MQSQTQNTGARMFSLVRTRIECRRGGQNYFRVSTCFSSIARLALAALFLFALGLRAPNAAAQGLDPAAMLKPATDTWPSYNGDYSGRRFSTLDQINATNVSSLSLAWIFHPHSVSIKSTPLEVNGIVYFTVPDNVWAVDARFGRGRRQATCGRQSRAAASRSARAEDSPR